MNAGHKHSSRWTFGDSLWHKVTGDKGLVVGVELRPQSSAAYFIIFSDSRMEDSCNEFELTDQPVIEGVTTP